MKLFQLLKKKITAKKTTDKTQWWKESSVYQIYPRSFCDSNNDGIGDIPGIISKLDYFVDLGIDVLWLSPVYCSPNYDNGYDISDYYNINPEFGTIKDMINLLKAAHKKNIKIIMDLVINHTSNKHPWFIESCKSKDNPYRDYYYWQEKPNNWTSFFTGPAWQYDETTNEYYLHLFAPEQPDLNFHNPKVIDEVKKIMEFWFQLGIDGFRCDVINLIWKTTLEDGKKNIALTGKEHYLTQEGCHQILKKLRNEVFGKYNVFMVGETYGVTTDMANDLCAENRGELDMVFGFEHMETDQINNKWFKTSFKPEKFFDTITKWQNEIEWNANYLENHDQPRSVSRFGDDKNYREESAKMLATMLCTLRGTPFIYQGEELGMTNGDFAGIDEIKDVESLNTENMAEDLHFPKSVRWMMIKKTSRDNARTPMQWNSSENAGFSGSGITPWLKINKNYKEINALNQTIDPSSVLSYYKKILRLRKSNPILIYGSYERIPSDKNIFAYSRTYNDATIYVYLNFSEKVQTLSTDIIYANILLGNLKKEGFIEIISELQPYEAIVFEQKGMEND